MRVSLRHKRTVNYGKSSGEGIELEWITCVWWCFVCHVTRRELNERLLRCLECTIWCFCFLVFSNRSRYTTAARISVKLESSRLVGLRTNWSHENIFDGRVSYIVHTMVTRLLTIDATDDNKDFYILFTGLSCCVSGYHYRYDDRNSVSRYVWKSQEHRRTPENVARHNNRYR